MIRKGITPVKKPADCNSFDTCRARTILSLSFVLLPALAAAFQGCCASTVRIPVPWGRHQSGGHKRSHHLNSSQRIDAEEDKPFQEFGTYRSDPNYQRRSKHWLLLVDDEQSIRQAVGQMLYEKGYQVTTCADGRAALKLALGGRATSEQDLSKDDRTGSQQNQIPDLIVSDVRMPDMDGLELLSEIRSNSKLMEIPVVLLTAKGLPNDRIAGYNKGADAYVPKPFDPDELVTIIDALLSRYRELNSSNVALDDLKRDVEDIKHLLLQNGGGGVGNGWVEATDVFLATDERLILGLLAEGSMTKEIADSTFLSTRRVEQLLTSMFRKTGVKNRTELVRWAISTGNVKI